MGKTVVDFTEIAIKDYLDGCIRHWRNKNDVQYFGPDESFMASCYVDAFQSIRVSIFGELLK